MYYDKGPKVREMEANVTVLVLPNLDDTFILDTNASYQTIGAVLSQIQNKHERAIAYVSIALTLDQKRQCTTRKNSWQCRHYLLAKSYHSSLCWIMDFKI